METKFFSESISSENVTLGPLSHGTEDCFAQFYSNTDVAFLWLGAGSAVF